MYAVSRVDVLDDFEELQKKECVVSNHHDCSLLPMWSEMNIHNIGKCCMCSEVTTLEL